MIPKDGDLERSRICVREISLILVITRARCGGILTRKL